MCQTLCHKTDLFRNLVSTRCRASSDNATSGSSIMISSGTPYVSKNSCNLLIRPAQQQNATDCGSEAISQIQIDPPQTGDFKRSLELPLSLAAANLRQQVYQSTLQPRFVATFDSPVSPLGSIPIPCHPFHEPIWKIAPLRVSIGFASPLARPQCLLLQLLPVRPQNRFLPPRQPVVVANNLRRRICLACV